MPKQVKEDNKMAGEALNFAIDKIDDISVVTEETERKLNDVLIEFKNTLEKSGLSRLFGVMIDSIKMSLKDRGKHEVADAIKTLQIKNAVVSGLQKRMEEKLKEREAEDDNPLVNLAKNTFMVMEKLDERRSKRNASR